MAHKEEDMIIYKDLFSGRFCQEEESNPAAVCLVAAGHPAAGDSVVATADPVIAATNEKSDDYMHPETMDGVPIRKFFISNLAEKITFKDLRK
ncbi:uncharacterized protein LOC105284360 isoform X2 [Ooceraea biroi]|uniref:uncharacterized protein LOC105284360 isoform X2 n=1 Tax=Ooceraea biroi TaxID=2015173 RepID=UPI0005BB66B4|nr:uncharacterized protein LOC105284360 isoform X2 [Ooceraea biroi]